MALEQNPDFQPDPMTSSQAPRRKRRWVSWAVFFAVIAAALFLHRCPSPPPPPPEPKTIFTPQAEIPETTAARPRPRLSAPPSAPKSESRAPEPETAAAE